MYINPKYARVITHRANVRSGGPLRELAIDAAVSGATITYDGEFNTYYLDPDQVAVAEMQAIASVPNTTIENYYITRYLAVADLSENLPSELPESSMLGDDGVIRQLTWQEVQDLSTINVQPIEGVYYFNVTAHIEHRGLTLEEYLIASALPLLDSPPEQDTNLLE